MASIRQRGNHFQARVIRKGFPNSVKSFPTRQEAEQWARQREANIAPLRAPAEGTIAYLQTPTLAKALDRYAREVTPTKRGAP